MGHKSRDRASNLCREQCGFQHGLRRLEPLRSPRQLCDTFPKCQVKDGRGWPGLELRLPQACPSLVSPRTPRLPMMILVVMVATQRYRWTRKTPNSHSSERHLHRWRQGRRTRGSTTARPQAIQAHSGASVGRNFFCPPQETQWDHLSPWQRTGHSAPAGSPAATGSQRAQRASEVGRPRPGRGPCTQLQEGPMRVGPSSPGGCCSATQKLALPETCICEYLGVKGGGPRALMVKRRTVVFPLVTLGCDP